jgi:signal transduction histidine kinase
VSRIPIRLRLTLVFAAVMALVLATVGLVLYVRLGQALDDRIADSLDTRTTALQRTSDPTAVAVSGDEGVAQVLDDHGTVVAGSSTAARTTSLLTAAEVERARTGAITVDSDAYRLRATPSGERVLVVGETLDDRGEALRGLVAQLLVVLPIALLVSSTIGYFVAGAALRPVEAMRRQASAVTAETAERRLPLPAAHDEVYRLGVTLNEMLARLDAGLERERRFVADASHELRTPLAILKTELEVSSRLPRSREELESSIRSAAEETERLIRLAEDLLLVARSDQSDLRLQPAIVSADELLDVVAARFESTAVSAGRAIDVASAEGIDLELDRSHVERALGNLVDNALRHGSGQVRLRATRKDGVVELHVIDGGAGFEPEFLPVAFERFTRADEARGSGGTGLGLAIVDAVARAHRGSAHAANLDGAGADVWITLPTRLNAVHAPRTDRRDLR